MFGACVEQRDKRINLTFYVARDLTDAERHDLTTAGAMVIADYADDYTIHEDFAVVADMKEPLRTKGTWVLLQRGFLTVECDAGDSAVA